MKKFAMIVAAGALFVAGLMTGTTATRTTETGLYPRSGIVTRIDADADVVEWTDGAGLVWSMTGVDDWMIGDGIAAIMDDNGTETIYDDVIVSARYAG